MTIFSIQCSGRVDGDGEHSIRLIDVCPVHDGGLLIVSHISALSHIYTLYMHISSTQSHCDPDVGTNSVNAADLIYGVCQ